MALREILVKKLEYQIFAWQKEIDTARKSPPQTTEAGKNPHAVAEINEDPQSYIQRLERNLKAAQKKIDEVEQADEKRLLVLKKQLSDWMDSSTIP